MRVMVVLLFLSVCFSNAHAIDSQKCLQKELKPRSVQTPATEVISGTFVQNELNEFLGDTVIVGYSDYEDQHNSTVGRNLIYDPVTECVYVVWDDYVESTDQRFAHINKVQNILTDPSAMWADGVSLGGARSGFPVIASDPFADTPTANPVYDIMTIAGGDRHCGLSSELALIPGVWTQFVADNRPDREFEWVQSAMAGNIIHVLGADRDAEEMYYLRIERDANGGYTVLNEDAIPTLVSTDVDHPSYDIAVGPNGQRVAIATPMPRGILGVIPETQDEDKDLIVWISEDGGVTWDFDYESALNVTNFQGPDMTLLPDTIAADQDTFRLWLDCNVYFDHNAVLHAAWSASQYYYIENSGLVYSQIFYWNEVDNYYIRLADGSFWNNWAGGVGTNNMIVQRPSLYVDPSTEWTWCIYQMFGIPGDIDPDENPYDVGENGLPNADLWVTASPSGTTYREFDTKGLLWFEGVNITNTRTESTSIPPGDSRLERDPCFALNNDGDYLHIFFSMDLDPGLAWNGGSQYTNNPMNYMRLEKAYMQDVLAGGDSFVTNIPMHVNGTGYWEDPLNWELSVDPNQSEQIPASFAIDKAWPNPFNSSTRIKYSVNTGSNINAVLYDVLGREVMSVVHGYHNPGSYEVLIEANTLSSGVYFLKLENEHTQVTKKLIMMK